MPILSGLLIYKEFPALYSQLCDMGDETICVTSKVNWKIID